MVTACRRAGVKVYVDAVINHTTGQGSTSYGGQDFTPYNYPAIPYVPNDFHFPKGECSSTDGGIQDFNNKNQVFKCNLVGLEDLDTDRPMCSGAGGLPQQAARLRRLGLPRGRGQAHRPGRPGRHLLPAEQDQGRGQAVLGA